MPTGQNVMKWTVGTYSWRSCVFAPVARAQTPASSAGRRAVDASRHREGRDRLAICRTRWSRSSMPRESSVRRRWTPKAWPRSRDLQPGTYQVTGQRRRVPRRRRCRSPFAAAPTPRPRRWRSPSLEQITVADQAADDRRDNGFTQTLTADEIDALLRRSGRDGRASWRSMAGPGAQIFVDGFRGGRLPPKDQIQQIRFNSNSFSAEYHEAGMVRVEVITRPGMGGWRGRGNFGFRDESLNARNAFSDDEGADPAAALRGSASRARSPRARPASRCRSTATTPTTRAPSARRRRPTSR